MTENQFIGAVHAQPVPRPTVLTRVRRHVLAIILVLAASLLAGFAYLSTRTDKYRAEARVLVTPSDRDRSPLISGPLVIDNGDPVRSMQTAAALMETRDVAGTAAKAIGGQETTQTVIDAVQISPEGQSSIITVSATAATPEKAAAIANAYVEASLTVRRRLFARLVAVDGDSAGQLKQWVDRKVDPNLLFVDRAAAPTSPVGLPPAIVIALCFLNGLALSAGAVLALEALADARARARAQR